MGIEGFYAGEPTGICEWCWRTTYDVGIAPFQGGRTIPVHVTCIMQMQAIKGKLAARREITGKTLAERRYLRMRRVYLHRLDQNVVTMFAGIKAHAQDFEDTMARIMRKVEDGTTPEIVEAFRALLPEPDAD